MAADTAQKRLSVIRFGNIWSGPGYPASGNSLARSANLHLYAMQGAGLVVVQDVTGQTQVNGTGVLQGDGFAVVVVTAYSSTVPVGVIISQVPVGGSSAALGSIVTITVSLGAEPNTRRGGGRPRDHQYQRRTLTLKEQPNKHLDSILDEVEAEVLYRDIVQETKALPDAARIAIAPFTKSEAAEPQASSVDWKAMEQDVTAVRELLAVWNQVQRDKKRRIADEEWILLGD